MAKIISSRKKYVPVKDLKVYPSNKETIANGEMTEIRIKYTAEKCE